MKDLLAEVVAVVVVTVTAFLIIYGIGGRLNALDQRVTALEAGSGE